VRDSTHHHSDFPRPRVDVRVRRRLRAHPVRVAVDAALGGRGDQHSNVDAAVLVSRPFFVDPGDGNLKAVVLFACVGLFFPGAVALLNFESNRLMGPNIAGALSSLTPVFAVLLAIVILGERIRGPELLALAALVVGISLMYRVHVNLSARSLWLMALPVAASAIRGVI
jgi:drug/metabolite transporter (DMT)-like permease